MSITAEEIKELESEKTLIVKKLGKLREGRILSTDPADQFKLDHEISILETRRIEIDRTISEGYNLSTESGKLLMRETIAQLKISENMGRIHIVNCNRNELKDRFEDSFDQKSKAKFLSQFYFLSACPTQLPPSFGERMVYETLGDLLDEKKGAVFCKFDPKNNERILIQKLPLGYSLEKSQEDFRAFFSGLFGFDDTTSFEYWMTEKLPLLQYEYIILPFFIRKKEWKEFIPAYFDWIAGQCNQRNQNRKGPTLLFFIIVYHDYLHRGEDQRSTEILKSINGFCMVNSNAGHFYPLAPIAKDDFRDWIMDLGERNPARIGPVLDTLRKGLCGDDALQYDKEDKLNMDDVEIAQELIFEFFNK